ncbi:MAG: phosphotransferase [Actinomycetota bacterium]|nr:MAG: aminoglycoside phosphotransferase [Acidimicrobiaceae bacterium]
MSIAEEPAEVKPPAELDRVLTHLRDHGAPHLMLDGAPTRLSGGFWAEMWVLSLAKGTRSGLPDRVVLRLAPDAQLAAWETTFQAGVAEQGFPTPTIRGFDFGPAHGQRAWCVMDHVVGTPLLTGLSGARAILALPRLATALPDTLARAAVDLHRLDPEPVAAALRRATGRVACVDGLLDHYLTRSRDLEDVPLQATLGRLAATRPAARPPTLCHGDLHPFNVLATDAGHVVLDWTAGQIADPAYDIAFTHLLIANPPLAAPKPLRPLINAAARRVAGRFVTTYRMLGTHSIDSDTFDWYRTLHACRIMTDLAGWRADGTIEARAGHPWLAMEPALQPLLGS